LTVSPPLCKRSRSRHEPSAASSPNDERARQARFGAKCAFTGDFRVAHSGNLDGPPRTVRDTSYAALSHETRSTSSDPRLRKTRVTRSLPSRRSTGGARFA
jgi:hypothetical protein